MDIGDEWWNEDASRDWNKVNKRKKKKVKGKQII
jgi:hypothetical protein